MIVQLEIPKEFIEDYRSDRFNDFFGRVIAGMKENVLCGTYELETAVMLMESFKESRCLDYEKAR